MGALGSDQIVWVGVLAVVTAFLLCVPRLIKGKGGEAGEVSWPTAAVIMVAMLLFSSILQQPRNPPASTQVPPPTLNPLNPVDQKLLLDALLRALGESLKGQAAKAETAASTKPGLVQP